MGRGAWWATVHGVAKSRTSTEQLHFQTMVEVMKIMVTSLKRYYPFTATVHTPNPAAGRH